MSTKRPIYGAIKQKTTIKQMKEMQRNPPRELVEATCAKCSLKESKPGVVYYPQNLLAAVDRAATLSKRMRAKVTYTEDDLSPRCLAALVGLSLAETKFEAELSKEIKSTSNGNAASSSPSGEGYFE